MLEKRNPMDSIFSQQFRYKRMRGVCLLVHADTCLQTSNLYFIFRSIFQSFRFRLGRCFTGGEVIPLPTVGVPPKVGPIVG